MTGSGAAGGPDAPAAREALGAGLGGGWRGLLLATGFFSTLSIALTWPLALHLETHMWSSSAGNRGVDVPLLAWTLAWDVHALLTRPERIFHANILFPNPLTLASADHMLGIVPFFVGPYLATGNALLAQNVAVLVSNIVAGLGMFVLVRYLAGSASAGVLAGVVFAYAPVRLGHQGHVNLLFFVWAALALYCLERFVVEGRRRHLLGLVVTFVLQCLASLYLAYMVTLALVAYAVVRLACERALLSWRPIRRLAGAGALTGIFLALVHLPYLEIQRTWGSDTWALRLLVRMSAAPMDFVSGGLFSQVLGTQRSQDVPWEKAVGLGAVASALALSGLWITLRSRERRLRARGLGLAAVLALGGVLSLGPRLVVADRDTGIPLPYVWLSAWVPGASGLRSPGRFGFLVALAAAVFAGVAVVALAGRLRVTRWGRAAPPVLTGVLILAFLAETIPPGVHAEAAPEARVAAVYHWLAARPGDGPIAEVPRSKAHDYAYIYASTAHWRPIANGGHGFRPKTSSELFRYLERMPDPEVARRLAAVGVRQLVVHEERLSDAERAWWTPTAAAAAGLVLAARVGEAAVYQLPPPQAPGALRLEFDLEPAAGSVSDSVDPSARRPRGPRALLRRMFRGTEAGQRLGIRLHVSAAAGVWVQPAPYILRGPSLRWTCPGRETRDAPVVATIRLPLVVADLEAHTYTGSVQAPPGWERCQMAVGLPSLGVWSPAIDALRATTRVRG